MLVLRRYLIYFILGNNRKVEGKAEGNPPTAYFVPALGPIVSSISTRREDAIKKYHHDRIHIEIIRGADEIHD